VGLPEPDLCRDTPLRNFSSRRLELGAQDSAYSLVIAIHVARTDSAADFAEFNRKTERADVSLEASARRDVWRQVRDCGCGVESQVREALAPKVFEFAASYDAVYLRVAELAPQGSRDTPKGSIFVLAYHARSFPCR